MNDKEKYLRARDRQVKKNEADLPLHQSVCIFTEHLVRTNYVKSFTWMGQPILQYPGDLMVLQEIIWAIQPQYIIECGIAFGGLTLFCASLLKKHCKVIGIDIDIRVHNMEAIKSHPYGKKVTLIQGDSTSPETVEKVKGSMRNQQRVMVILDSNHTANHVLKELELYTPFVTLDSYCVVFDTAIEYFMKKKPKDRPWGPGNNPYTAVKEFMKDNKKFVVDREVETRALITGAPGGWLRRV